MSWMYDPREVQEMYYRQKLRAREDAYLKHLHEMRSTNFIGSHPVDTEILGLRIMPNKAHDWETPMMYTQRQEKRNKILLLL